jgi:hypothetical protein
LAETLSIGAAVDKWMRAGHRVSSTVRARILTAAKACLRFAGHLERDEIESFIQLRDQRRQYKALAAFALA